MSNAPLSNDGSLNKQGNTPLKVLIADDSRLTRMSLKTTLAMVPGKIQWVGEAEEGREAIALTEQFRPDLILMDVGMPVMDGIRATQAIRSRYPEVKVIMLTSHESEADILESFRSGANSFCLKETLPETLIQIILSTAQGACWIDPKIARVFVKDLTPSLSREQASGSGISLTERERDVLKLITDGLNNTEIAEKLCISLNTIKTHIKNIFQKLEVEDRTAAVLKAIREKLV